MRARRVAPLFALVAALATCAEPTAPAGDPRLVIVGYLEVGEPLEVLLVRGTDTTHVLQAALQISPPGSVTFPLSGNTFVFSAPGLYNIAVTISPGQTIFADIAIASAPTIVFDMILAGNRDVYRAALDGSQLERLTTNTADDLDPTAAGNALVFTSYRDGNAELYSRPLNSGAETRLTVTGANETEAALSPDGARLAYTRDDGGTPRVWIATSTATAASLLTSATGSTIEGGPGWRSTSDSLLLISTSLGNASIFRASRLVGTTPATTAKPATGDSVYVEPTWSVGWQFVALTAGRGSGAPRIAVLDRATNTSNYLTPATISAGQPTFLADGRIVFTIFAPTPGLAWVDPASPLNVHPIPLTGTNPQHPAIIWP